MTDLRLYGVIAYGTVKEVDTVIEALAAINPYIDEDTALTLLKLDIELAFSRMTLTKRQADIVRLYLDGVKVTGIAALHGVDKAYVSRVKALFLKELAEDFKEQITAEEYRKAIKAQRRYNRR